MSECLGTRLRPRGPAAPPSVEGALAEIPRRHGARQAPGLLDHVFGLGLKAHRVLVTPLRSFAFRKAAMFAAFSLGLLAIKAKVTVQATTWAAAVTIPDPSLGQVIAVSTVVVAFATINAVVFVITQRAQDRMREGYLRVIADSRTPEDLRRELLGRL